MVALTKSQNKWGFACGRISVLEGRLMSYDYYAGLAGLERVEDMFQRLQDSALREYMAPGAVTWEDWSAIVDAYIHDVATSLRRDCPSPSVCDLFTLAEDFLNLKRAVLNRPPYPFLTNLFTDARLNEVASGNTNLLPDVIRPALAQLTLLGGDAQNVAAVDMALDGAYLRHYLSLAASTGAPLIVQWSTERVLARAVTALWRSARAGRGVKDFTPYLLPLDGLDGILLSLIDAVDPRSWGALIPGRIGDLFRESLDDAEDEQPARFEQRVSNYLTGIARTTKLQTAGPERAAGYMWGLWVEAFNMKLVISGKLNRIESDALKSRVRETYV